MSGGDLGQAAAEAATLADELASITAPAVVLTESEQELLRDETEYLLGSAADAIKAAATAGEIDDGMRKFRVAGVMLAASEPGRLPCDPDVLATITRTLEMLQQDIAGHAKALAEFDEHGPAGYLDERLRSKLTVTEMLEDIAGTREDVERHTRQQEMFAGIMARVEQGES